MHVHATVQSMRSRERGARDWESYSHVPCGVCSGNYFIFKYFANGEVMCVWGFLCVSEDLWRFVQTLCITDYY